MSDLKRMLPAVSAIVLAGCGVPSTPDVLVGDWRVTGYAIPGISAMSAEEADTWVDAPVEFSDDEVRFGDWTCEGPAYEEVPVGDADLLSAFRVGGAQLGLGPERLGFRVSCAGANQAVPGSFVIVDRERLLTPWDGVFFELERGPGGDGASERVSAASADEGSARFATTCDPWDDWDEPGPPFRIHGGTYHVGTCGITVLLITGAEGHLIIDSGTRVGADRVAANVEALGFSLRDVRYLTHTQEHWDHTGGMARLQSRTGARMVASQRARSVFETGVLNVDDPQFGGGEPTETLAVDRVVADGEAISLGDKEVRAHYTPGHSPGAVSWQWEECEEDRCVTLVFTDGMSPVSLDGYRWTNTPDYLADYRASLRWLQTVEADICLSAHPSQMRLIERIEAGDLVDPDGCRRVAALMSERLDAVVGEEGGG